MRAAVQHAVVSVFAATSLLMDCAAPRSPAEAVPVEPAADPARMLAQVREPLLAALHLSPDFAPAYEPLLRLALALRASDPPAAQALLTALTRVAPAQAGAREALRQSAPAQ